MSLIMGFKKICPHSTLKKFEVDLYYDYKIVQKSTALLKRRSQMECIWANIKGNGKIH